MLNIGVLISGNGSNLQALIDNIKCGYIDAKISIVISDKPGVFGISRAESAGIKAISFDRKMMNSEELNKKIYDELKQCDVEVVVLAGYLSILSGEIIKAYKNAIVNIHPSLIPSFCGPGFYGIKVHKSAIEYGVKVSGCTVHYVDEGTDTGPIILQKTVEVFQEDTAETLQKRILDFEHQALPEALKLICQGRVSVCGRKVEILGEVKK